MDGPDVLPGVSGLTPRVLPPFNLSDQKEAFMSKQITNIVVATAALAAVAAFSVPAANDANHLWPFNGK